MNERLQRASDRQRSASTRGEKLEWQLVEQTVNQESATLPCSYK